MLNNAKVEAINATQGRPQLKTKITLRALEQRIGRRLSKDHQSLHKTRSQGKTIESLGPYYIVDDNTNSIAAHGIHADRLVEIGKEMDALAAWEEVDI